MLVTFYFIISIIKICDPLFSAVAGHSNLQGYKYETASNNAQERNIVKIAIHP